MVILMQTITKRKCKVDILRECDICYGAFEVKAYSDKTTCDSCSDLVQEIPYQDPEADDIVNSIVSGAYSSGGYKTPVYRYDDDVNYD